MRKEQVIYGFQPLLGFQHCPAILLVVSSQLLLPHPKVAIINLHHSHQDPVPAHSLSADDLASYFIEKTAVIKNKVPSLPSSSFHPKLPHILKTQPFREGEIDVPVSFQIQLSFLHSWSHFFVPPLGCYFSLLSTDSFSPYYL